MSLRDTILAAADAKLEAFDVPEWGCTVYLRVWTGRERSTLQQWLSGPSRNDAEMYGKVAALSLVDETGKRLFTDDDASALADKSGAVLERLTLASLKHNGIGPEAVDDAKKY